MGSGQGVCGLNVNLQDCYLDGGWRSLQLGQLELGVYKALRQAVDKSLPLPVQFKRSRDQPPHQEQSKQSSIGEERCICRRTPLVVTQGSANAGSNKTRRKGAQARDKDVVSRPFQFFSRPKRDSVTDPIGAELRGPCAFHGPHLLPGQYRYSGLTENRQRRRHVQAFTA